MDLNVFQIGFIVASVVGGALALMAAQPRPEHMKQLALNRENQREFASRWYADPKRPAEEKFSKDMAKFRHDNAHSRVLGSPDPAQQRMVA